MTLVELVVSVTLSVIIFLIVFQFISDWLWSMLQSRIKTETLNESFSFRDKLFRYFRWWYNNADVIWTQTVNNVLFLHDDNHTKGVIFWVVNRDIMKLQYDYVYWDNVLWYRELSPLEISNIIADNSYIYSLNFHNDKLFVWMRVKDFKASFYNLWDLIDIYLSLVLRRDNTNFWESFSDWFINQDDILDFNLDF